MASSYAMQLCPVLQLRHVSIASHSKNRSKLTARVGLHSTVQYHPRQLCSTHLKRTVSVKCSGDADLPCGPVDGEAPAQSSRRAMLLAAASLVTRLGAFAAVECSSAAAASTSPQITDTVYLDVAVNGDTIGRIEIGLYGNDSPVAAERFQTIMGGPNGQSYRNSKFSTIRTDLGFIRDGGLKSLRLGNSDLELQGLL